MKSNDTTCTIEPKQSNKKTSFEKWWHQEGYRMKPSAEEDAFAFAKRVTGIAWSNGMHVQRYRGGDDDTICTIDGCNNIAVGDKHTCAICENNMQALIGLNYLFDSFRDQASHVTALLSQALDKDPEDLKNLKTDHNTLMFVHLAREAAVALKPNLPRCRNCFHVVTFKDEFCSPVCKNIFEESMRQAIESQPLIINTTKEQ